MIEYLIGVDEAGRGPLAGPVAVAAVAAPVSFKSVRRAPIAVRDSKRLSPDRREALLARMEECRRLRFLDFAVSLIGERLIDQFGIGAAVQLGIDRCLRRLVLPPVKCLVLLDGGLRAPRRFAHQETIVRGDERHPLIALASVAAKVRRDRRMVRSSLIYPAYGFEKHKGYGTRTHYAALRRYGCCPLHRRSFLKGFCFLPFDLVR